MAPPEIGPDGGGGGSVSAVSSTPSVERSVFSKSSMSMSMSNETSAVARAPSPKRAFALRT